MQIFLHKNSKFFKEIYLAYLLLSFPHFITFAKILYEDETDICCTDY
jgi:hypothetical protein